MKKALVAIALALSLAGCPDDPLPDCRDLGCPLALCNRSGECKCDGQACKFYVDGGSDSSHDDPTDSCAQ